MAVLSKRALLRDSTRKDERMWSREITFAVLSLMILGSLSLLGCGGGGVNANNNVTAISITPTSANVSLNGQTDFSATVTLANSTITTNTTVTWQVNGTSGGNISTVGSIVASPTDANVGVYTAPAAAPSTNINITAIINETTSSTSTATTTITSNTATVTIGGGTGLSITAPTQVTVPAGGKHQFNAELNGISTAAVTWAVSSANGGNVGTIDSTGNYVAPGAPPPGGSVTITASYTPAGQTTAQTATATAIVVYSDASLNGPFAFSYTGNNTSGLISVAGRFVTDGAGTITSGVEDIVSFGSSLATRVQFLGGSSYKVGGDGRAAAVIITPQGDETWQFVVSSSQHAVMTRFDSDVTAHGAIDQQNLDALSNVISAFSGNYVFSAAGGDDDFHPMAIAGRFTANAGAIPQSGSILDKNDNGTVTAKDATLNGSYSVASIDADTGRGTLNLSATNTIGSLTFVFYMVDNTHIYIVESDQVDYLAGSIYSAPATTPSTLASGNYTFTAGGNSSTGSYAAGGIFISDGNGNLNSSGGILDTNNAGTVTAATALSACPYAVDAATGRIDIFLATASGACTAGSGSSEFAIYQTAQNTALMLELDSTISTGTAYLQSASPAALSGNFALGFFGQGVFQNAPASYQSNATGHAVLAGTGVSSGDIDINTFGAAYPSDPIATSTTTTTPGSSIGAPGPDGRGTATFVATDPPATYSIVYYLVNANTAIFVGQDKSRVETGVILLQY